MRLISRTPPKMPSLSARCAVRVGAAVLLLLLAESAARAHPLAPALLDLRELGSGRVAVSWKASLLGVPGAAVAPVLPADCRRESAPVATADADSVTRTWTVVCRPSGLVGGRIGFSGLADAKIDALVRISLADGRVVRGVVRGDDPLLTVPARVDRLDLMRAYARLGVARMLTGLDHLIFLAALLLLVRGRWRLIETIAAFTVGHSLTLSLVGLDIVSVPPWPIELGIAFSAFLVAVALAREPSAPASFLRRRPWAVALAFGLLYGLGLASAVRDSGLPSGDAPLALFGFNLGVEIGQVAFVIVLLAAASTWRALRVAWPRWAAQLPLYAMGSLAALWCFERAAALLH
jgi:hypothetical protein